MEVRRTALVQFSATTMFDLIEAAEHYPSFLPWCVGATVLQRDDSVVIADIHVNYRNVRFDFTTRNPKHRPDFMAITLERGPFRRFEGDWHLAELAPDACKVDFALRYDFDSSLMGRLARPVFDRIANTLVDAFVARAEQLRTPATPAVPPPVFP
jgi:ribosome-associated toxin RatA of RatAB toxin-antitoxin module